MIGIGRRGFFFYLLLPHHIKMALLSPEDRARLDDINRRGTETMFSDVHYDEAHAYGGPQQTEYPAASLVREIWSGRPYGHALELGAGSGYYTGLIAQHAASVTAVEPVPSLQTAIIERCRRQGYDNVRVVDAWSADIDRVLEPDSVDSAFLIHSLHHFHRRPEIFQALGRVVRPGGRLYVVEPHHNLRRVLRLIRKYVTIYRPRRWAGDPLNWGTHDFLTVDELRRLCHAGGFAVDRIAGFWLPGLRRLLGDDQSTRARWERRVGRTPVLRHFGSEVALEATRWPASIAPDVARHALGRARA